MCVKGLQWLKEPDLTPMQKVRSGDVVFTQVMRTVSRLKMTNVEANLHTGDGMKVKLEH